jgi:hypothetical protein
MVDVLATYADPYKESVLILGGPKGLVLVTETAEVEIELEHDYDTQRRKGYNAARPKFVGIKPAEINVEFVVLPDEEVAFFRDVVPILRPKGKKGASQPLDILNHQANRVGITTVTLRRAKIGKPSPRDGRHVSMQLQEWSPAPVEPNASNAKKDQKSPPGIDPINVFTNQ